MQDKGFIKALLRKYLYFFVLLGIMGLLLAFIETFVIKESGKVLDILYKAQSLQSIESKLIHFLILLLIMLGFQIIVAVVFAMMRRKVLLHAQKQMLQHLLYLMPEVFYKYRKGDLAERISSNIHALRSFFDQSLLQTITSLGIMLFSIYFLYRVHPVFSGIYIAYMVLAFFIAFIFATFIQKIFARYYNAHAELSSLLLEILNGFIAIKTLLQGIEFIKARFFKKVEETTKRMFIADISLFGSIGVYVLTLAMFIFAILFIGSKMVYKNTITLGSLVSALALFYMASNNFNQVNNSISKLKSAFAALNRVDEFMSEPEENRRTQEIEFRHMIELKEVDFSYDGKNYLFKDLNLVIRKGDFVGIKGPTGSGKTSFLYLIAGLLFPTKGDILIDGVKLTLNNVLSYRRKIGYLPQEPFIISGSLKENILFGLDFDEGKFRKVIKEAGLEGFFEKYGKKYDMELKEGGKNLSGGEKQRIHLARILYMEPEIYLFDEPTSNIDEETERIIVSTIEKLHKEGKTLIVVSHKPLPLKSAERILEIREGSIRILQRRLSDVKTSYQTGEFKGEA